MGSDLERYERFGWDYERHNPLSEAEVAWHLRWARATGGPVLGLACGTARLLCRMAEAGFEVVGVDLSGTMMELARRNVAVLDAAARGRVELLQGDMLTFELGRVFGLVVIADNSLRVLDTREQLLQCMERVRGHLRPEGRVLITERRFEPELYAEGPRRSGWSEPFRIAETGEVVSRRVEVGLSEDGRRLYGKMVYRVSEPGPERVVELPFETVAMTREEYEELFAEAGFGVEVYGGYNGPGEEAAGMHWCFVLGRG